MKRVVKKSQKITKGMPSAVVLSIVIHVALFLLAGMLVVFTVVKKEDKKFVPPKAVERPKMKLRKPKVKVKKSAKPKPTTRIVTKVRRASMPDIQLPEMSGMTAGLAGGIGGFDMMPDLGEVSVFGSGQSIGNDFAGTFYDFKRDRSGRNIPMGNDQFKAAVSKFVRGGWKDSYLSRYYRSPKTLYATSIMVPLMLSYLAPAYFGEPDTGGYNWLVHYQGQLVHKNGGRFRFWGRGDDILIVRLDGKIVLDGSVDDRGERPYCNWQNSDPASLRYYMSNRTSVVGDWFTLEPGIPLEMEVIIGEVPGGEFSAMLVVQEEGVEYEKNRQNGPILPMFKTTEPSRDLTDVILRTLVPGEASITNGPVFCDYDSSVRGIAGEPAAPEPASSDTLLEENGTRIWTGEDGKVLKAEYVMTMGGRVLLKTTKGKQLKIPLTQLSMDDREFVELANPPTFSIDYVKKSSQRQVEAPPGRALAPIRVLDYTFGAKLKQTSAGSYNHELRVEYYAIGAEIDGDNHILLDRKTSTFVPAKENQRSHVFKGKPVELVDYVLDSQRRGTKPGGHLITVTDERGKIIDYSASGEWLFGNLENLKQLPVGSYMDKTCARVYPTSPKANRY